MGSRRPPRVRRALAMRGGRVLALVAVLALASTACEDPGPGGSPGLPARIASHHRLPGARRRVHPPRRGRRATDARASTRSWCSTQGSEAERRFVGGGFAVPVPRLPEGAEVVGVGDGAQLVTVPDGPRWLYTVRGSAVWRWLALPPAGAIAADPPQGVPARRLPARRRGARTARRPARLDDRGGRAERARLGQRRGDRGSAHRRGPGRRRGARHQRSQRRRVRGQRQAHPGGVPRGAPRALAERAGAARRRARRGDQRGDRGGGRTPRQRRRSPTGTPPCPRRCSSTACIPTASTRMPWRT